ncbi:MAG TPA: sigma-70 family RNA polymerase sigma factor [Chitinophagaceae bacterium]|nr:sigma-70 family RNA polymerase sigma factor [Chitinophagaceae bacterium]
MEVVRNFPDSELLADIRDRHKLDKAVRVLYQSYFDSLSWYVLNNSGNIQDAEDIFQEVIVLFIDLVQKNKFREESTIKTFLYALNRHAWLNELKKRGRTLAREEKYENEKDQTTADMSRLMVEREEKAAILKLVSDLGENCKKILLLFYYENLSMKEITEQTNYENEQVVRNKKYKCLKALEKMINENPPLKITLKNMLHGS